jgi:hypothetical protein
LFIEFIHQPLDTEEHPQATKLALSLLEVDTHSCYCKILEKEIDPGPEKRNHTMNKINIKNNIHTKNKHYLGMQHHLHAPKGSSKIITMSIMSSTWIILLAGNDYTQVYYLACVSLSYHALVGATSASTCNSSSRHEVSRGLVITEHTTMNGPHPRLEFRSLDATVVCGGIHKLGSLNTAESVSRLTQQINVGNKIGATRQLSGSNDRKVSLVYWGCPVGH